MMMDNVHRWYTDDQFPQPELILPSWARVVFDQAFHRRDPDRSGVIDSEVVAEVMRDLGIKPEPGEVLGQPGAMLSYADVEKMMADNAHRWYTDGTLPRSRSPARSRSSTSQRSSSAPPPVSAALADSFAPRTDGYPH